MDVTCFYICASFFKPETWNVKRLAVRQLVSRGFGRAEIYFESVILCFGMYTYQCLTTLSKYVTAFPQTATVTRLNPKCLKERAPPNERV